MNAMTPIDTATMTGRAILETQVAQLEAALAVGTCPFSRRHAERLLGRARYNLEGMTEAALTCNAGLFGANGWQLGVDDVCRALWASAAEDLAA